MFVLFIGVVMQKASGTDCVPYAFASQHTVSVVLEFFYKEFGKKYQRVSMAKKYLPSRDLCGSITHLTTGGNFTKSIGFSSHQTRAICQNIGYFTGCAGLKSVGA